MIKEISHHYTAVLLFFITITLQAQTPATITKENYTNTEPVTLTATQSIVIKPNSVLKPGFTARIGAEVKIPETYVPGTFSNDNYIVSRVFQKPVTAVSQIQNKEDVIENILYFDGLGRPVQTTAIGQGGTNIDIITPIEYDEFGRQTKEYLPYPVTNTTANHLVIPMELSLTALNGVYNSSKYENTANPFSEKKLESSPLNRILEQAAPGNDWALNNPKKNTIKLDYQANISSDAVRLYKTTTTWQTSQGLYDIAFSDAGSYAQYELYKNATYDENSGVNPVETAGSTVEFKNKEGQVVLKRTYNANAKHDTYYVWDEYGNLTYVIPPKADGTITQAVLDGLCYQYKYDNRNRMAEKKIPGKQWEYIVYDKLDRPVATGPAFSPFKDEVTAGWLITKYDAFSRPVYTGWSSQSANSLTRNTLQTAQNAAKVLFETKQISGTIDGISAYYTNAIAPTTFKLLTVNYYDNYAFPGAQTIPSTIEGQAVLTNVKALATGSWTRAVTTAMAIAGETNTLFYDSKTRPIRNYNQNYLGGYTSVDSNLDFSGKTLYTITKHKRIPGSTETIVREDFAYTMQNRLETHTHQINGGVPQLMTANTYDNLGQLTNKNVGNNTSSPLQKVDFAYNIRGWLTAINDTKNLQAGNDPKDLFAFKINYNKIEGNATVAKALYNGNIAETFWTANTDGGILRGYGYQYDALNRLTNATYQTPKLADNKNYFGENLNYDKNGNIIKLQRKFMAGTSSNPYQDNMDDLGYLYTNNSNQLTKVTDGTNNPEGFKSANKTGDDYAYDLNGNLIKDQNKEITLIEYNHLNLPKKITFGAKGNIVYVYNATGQKIQKIVTETGKPTITTDYLGGFQYKDNILQFFPTAEGYVNNTAGVLSYVFQYKDHLGNVRVSYAKNTTQVLEIIEETHYYPFGLKHVGYVVLPATNNKYKYNGKELQDELGLGFYDYGWRNYDPAIARWVNPDPLLNDLDFAFNDSKVDEDDEDEVYEALITKLDTGGGIYNPDNLNPYGYGYNNPVSFNDPDGRCPICPFIALAIMLLAPEPAMAPTKDHAGDSRKMTDAKEAKGELILSTIPIARGASSLNKLSNASKTKNEVEKTKEKIEVPKEKRTSSQDTKPSKVEKSKTTEKIGDKFTKKTEVRPSKERPGQSRAEYVSVKNNEGKSIRTYKDSYDRANKFQGRKPLRGGPEGRPQ